jgi:hypothetical protein
MRPMVSAWASASASASSRPISFGESPRRRPSHRPRHRVRKAAGAHCPAAARQGEGPSTSRLAGYVGRGRVGDG